MKFSTKAIHIGQAADPNTGSTIIPIHLSTTYTQAGVGQNKGFEYSRSGNPTRQAYEECLAALEDAQYALAFSSGCAASEAITHMMQAGDHAVISAEVYGGTYRLFEMVLKNRGLDFTWVKGTDPQDFADAIKPNTKMMWIETPTNPLVSIIDIAAVCKLAKDAGVRTVVDNTFATPYFQSPLALGADVVVHSTTKYIGGHSDVVGGALMLNDKELRDQLYFVQKSVGAVPSPFDCWLSLRGLKTLSLRMEQHSRSATTVAQWLRDHKAIDQVFFPGLPEHPGHDIAQKQMRGYSGMVSFTLSGGKSALEAAVQKLKLFSLAESLGGVESLCCYPAYMTHASVPEDERNAIGVTDNLLRLSVGIEDVEDLIADLDSALS